MKVCERPATRGSLVGNVATGTVAGYKRHRRAGESPCAECREAEYEQDRERARKRYAANPDKKIERSRRYYEANRDKVQARRRRYYQANRQRLIAYSRQWERDNPERVRASWRANGARKTQRRRVRKANVLSVPFTAEQLAERMSMWGGRCWLRIHCDGAPYEAVDHVIPISRGGPHCLSNLRPACKSCNSAKGANHPSELLEVA